MISLGSGHVAAESPRDSNFSEQIIELHGVPVAIRSDNCRRSALDNNLAWCSIDLLTPFAFSRPADAERTWKDSMADSG
jgi:hypothetical protein